MLSNIYRHNTFDPRVFVSKEIISFDSDGTLQLTKSKIDSEMAEILDELALHYKINVISGTGMEYLKPNVLDLLKPNPNITLSPTCGTRFVAYVDGEYKELYREELSASEIEEIMAAFEYAIEKAQHRPSQVWGEIVENRGTQVTFSALGQKAPADAKLAYDPDLRKRKEIVEYLTEKISPDRFDIKIAGGTSIDVTRKGISKGYGMHKLAQYYHVTLRDILFIGDRLDEIGNDYPVAEAGVDCIWVEGIDDTKKVLRRLLEAKKSTS
jgi:HAD superfamily hydrolase (TIGR01484 family)